VMTSGLGYRTNCLPVSLIRCTNTFLALIDGAVREVDERAIQPESNHKQHLEGEEHRLSHPHHCSFMQYECATAWQ